MHPVTAEVTERIVERSRDARAAYLKRMEAARSAGVGRAKLSCANWAHAFAAESDGTKQRLRDPTAPNVAIVSAYNDMLSAHQPLERYPAIIKAAAPMNKPGTILSQMPNNSDESKASWLRATAVDSAITSRLNSESSMPARPWVTPSHMAGTPPATCAVAPATRAAARITSG